MTIYGFDWDGGNIEKCKKHGVSLEEIEDLFVREPMILLNHRPQSNEARHHAVGRTEAGRYNICRVY